MFRGILPLTLSLCLGAATAPAALAQSAAPVTEQEAHAIAVDAYVYFYSIMSMDVSRKQFTNVEQGKDAFKGPMNTFVNVREYPPADFKGVVRSNFDTLYSSSWLDMTKEPVVISVAGHRWTLLSAADARHVDRCLCVAGLANDGHQGRDLSDNARRLAAGSARQVCRGVQASKGHPAHRRANALCLGDRPHQDRRPAGLSLRFTRSRPATRSRRFRNTAKRRSRSKSRSTQAST